MIIIILLVYVDTYERSYKSTLFSKAANLIYTIGQFLKCE